MLRAPERSIARQTAASASASCCTYRYRNPARRRANMASYMRDYRARKAQERQRALGATGNT
jgi:hypothetical protein